MTKQKYFMAGWHPAAQFFFLISISLVLQGAGFFLGTYLSKPFFNVLAVDEVMRRLMENPNSATPEEISAMKLVQFTYSLFAFLIAAVLFALMRFPGGDYMRIRRRTKFGLVLMGILILIVSTPFIDFTYTINQKLTLPASMHAVEQQIRDAEDAATKLTNLFLQMPMWMDLVINLIVLAIIPAIGEELFFRGCMQQILKDWTRNPHLAIWITAIVFSFFHFEFFGFVPRLLLGGLLGYLFYWSRTLWVPIIAHAFNNGAQVLMVYLHDQKIISYDIKSDNDVSTVIVIVSVVLTAGGIWAFRKISERRTFIY